MKWIGQHIYDLIARFRSDIYLEGISTSTETDMLVVDSSGKVSKRAIDAIDIDVSDFMTNGADNRVLTATGTDAMNAEANFTFDGNDVTISSSASGNTPEILLLNENTGTASASLQFKKSGSDSGADNDALGIVTFYGENDAGQSINYMLWQTVIYDATDGEEAVRSHFYLRSHGSASWASGLSMYGSSSVADVVDVTVAAGTTSDTTIAGNLIVTSDLTVSGTTTTVNTTNLNIEDKNITLNYNASSDTSSTADGAGITIQDAVDASNDASLTWTAADDTFEFSHAVEINNGASGGTTALIVDNDDVDQNAIKISALNTTADVLNIDSRALTTGDAIKIDCNNLTTGSALEIDIDDAQTGSSLGHYLNWIDYDKSGVIADGATRNTVGLKIDMTDAATNHANSTVKQTGVDVTLNAASNSGALEHVGFQSTNVGSGDVFKSFSSTLNDSLLNAYDFYATSSADTGDYFAIQTTTHGATTLTTVDDDAAAAHFEIAADGNITLDAEGDIVLEAAGYDITGDARNYAFTNSYSGKPLLTLESTNTTKTTSSELKFLKDAADVEDDEQLGKIGFYGDNDAGTPEEIQYGAIIGTAADMTDGQEAGELLFQVAEYDGTLTTGLKLDGDTNTDGEIDVTIGAGAASVTTIAGTLLVNESIKYGTGNGTVTLGVSDGDIVGYETDSETNKAFMLSNHSVGGKLSLYNNGSLATFISYNAHSYINPVSSIYNFGIGTSSPAGRLHVVSSANNEPAVLIDNNDVDQPALTIDAENTTADVISLDATALTTGNALNIDCNALTTGSALNIDVDDAGTTTLTKYLAHIDYDKSGNTASGQTHNLTGLRIDINDNATSNLGSMYHKGIWVNMDSANANGSQNMIGFQCQITDADTTGNTVGYYSYVEDGAIDFKAASTADAGDYFTIATTTHGATTLTTVDDDATAAHFEVAADGNITLDAAADIALESGADSTNSVSIDHRKFSVSTSTDGNAVGDVVYFGGTTSMTTGRIYYYKSDGTWGLADADAASTSTGLLGVALGGTSDTNGVLLRGMVTLNHDPGDIGDVLYVAPAGGLIADAGMATDTAPSGSGDIVRVIGYQVSHASNGNIWFNPDSTFVEVA